MAVRVEQLQADALSAYIWKGRRSHAHIVHLYVYKYRDFNVHRLVWTDGHFT